MRIPTPPHAANLRLDRYLAELYPALGRSAVARAITAGAVTVNGAAAKPGQRLRAGDLIEGEIAETPPVGPAPVAEAIPLDIVYQDDDLLVIDKPPGLVVHPAPGHPSGTLVNAILGLWRDPLPAESAVGADDTGDGEDGDGDGQRPGIVHRLDRETSGLLVVARTAAAQRALQRQMAARTTLKQYLALVLGRPDSDRGAIEAPIGRDPRDRKRMAVVATGRPSVTHFRVAESLPGHTLLDVTLETGRTHQIRVHLAAIGHPVAGDPLYGRREGALARLGLRRQFLHAYRLDIDHPTTGQRLSFRRDLPPDLAEPLARLRAAGSAPGAGAGN